MNEEAINTGSIDRIPLKERNAFQGFLATSMIGKDASIEDKIAWADKYGKVVSDIIDNTKNEEIRNYIFRGDHGTASRLVIEMLNREKVPAAA
jgi:hypothetical protein